MMIKSIVHGIPLASISLVGWVARLPLMPLVFM